MSLARDDGRARPYLWLPTGYVIALCKPRPHWPAPTGAPACSGLACFQIAAEPRSSELDPEPRDKLARPITAHCSHRPPRSTLSSNDSPSPASRVATRIPPAFCCGAPPRGTRPDAARRTSCQPFRVQILAVCSTRLSPATHAAHPSLHARRLVGTASDVRQSTEIGVRRGEETPCPSALACFFQPQPVHNPTRHARPPSFRGVRNSYLPYDPRLSCAPNRPSSLSALLPLISHGPDAVLDPPRFAPRSKWALRRRPPAV
ncbi:hypothetical protein B0J12DRAFT_693046 [Macrophomina phaseolina]|uniref:Uncharacterized protein n=1 Tax=Macrophomina phaseolina TaxID=35725 RepID=A0ABQ8GTN6_9PEZI|nr:hypothetical protein B0J12DRAFT_693046 [Macrophomina phaseolina]